MVCLLVPADEENIGIDIFDKLEVDIARWVPLKELASNEEGQTNYKMHYNAFRFMECVNRWVNKGKTENICINDKTLLNEK